MNQVPGVLWPSSVIAVISLIKTKQALYAKLNEHLKQKANLKWLKLRGYKSILTDHAYSCPY